MDWSSELRELRSELDSLRGERARLAGIEEAERQEYLAQMKGLFESLRIEDALGEMNKLLLDGKGKLETYSPWGIDEEPAEEDEETLDEEEETEEFTDSVSAILTWEDDGPMELAVDMGITERGFILQVNGNDVRLEEDALRQALIRAFREGEGL